jgi:hypothetical protein
VASLAPTRAKLSTRFCLALTCALFFACALRFIPWAAPVPIAFAVIALMRYRRRGPNRTPCVECPERTAAVCSGLRPIVRRERAFRRVASRLLHVNTHTHAQDAVVALTRRQA